MAPKNKTLSVCIVTPMTGSHPDGITTQGEILLRHFSKEFPRQFVGTSDKSNRYYRFWDMVQTLLRRRSEISIQFLHVYSGPSFVVADICSLLAKWLGQKLILHLHGGGLPDLFNR